MLIGRLFRSPFKARYAPTPARNNGGYDVDKLRAPPSNCNEMSISETRSRNTTATIVPNVAGTLRRIFLV